MPNIVVLTIPALGHITPCVTMANLLIPHGFTFTFVVTEQLAATLCNPNPSCGPNPSAPHEEKHEEVVGGLEKPLVRIGRAAPIRYVSIPSKSLEEAGQKPFDDSSSLYPHFEVMRSMRPGFEALLRSSSSRLGHVTCIIADFFVSWVTEVALQFHIPVFSMFTSNSHTLSAIAHLDDLIANGASPMSDPHQRVDCIPGILPLRAADLPESVRMYPSLAVELKKNMSRVAGIIVNTVYELERKCVDAVSQKVPVYPIGPMLLMSPHTTTRGRARAASVDTVTTGLWAEDRECLAWLDTALPSSVIFVSFGSLANLSAQQVKELAHGLDTSEQAFLWVVRSNSVVHGPWSSVLPENFVERTKGRGLIISWAPQLDVLSHPSVGGFLTHCGWNSITENLSTACVPMLCWPQIAEQRLNARILVDEWRVGLDLTMEYDSLVKAVDIQRAVRDLMQGDIGREIKNRTLGLKEVVAQSVQEAGSSQCYLRSLVQDLKRTCDDTLKS